MCDRCNERDSMTPDDDDNEVNQTDEEFVGIVNNNNWEPDPGLQYKIVQAFAFTGIVIGICAGVALLLGTVVWVWRNALG